MAEVKNRKLKVKSLGLSVIIIAKNEEEVLGECLESVRQLADEIIVLDTGSTDKTIEVAKKFEVKVFDYPHKSEVDYSAWRNYASSKVTREWLFYLDSDERVPPLLRREIEALINGQGGEKYSAFEVPRRNIRLGREMKYGGWWPDYVLRLVRKDKLQRWEGQLHEQPIIKGEVGRLKEALVHYSHRGSFEHKVANTIFWSGLEAELLFKANHPPMNVKRFLGAMGREFYRRMIKYQAWRDGTEGVIEAIYQVFSVFITYARLWEMQSQASASKKN